MKSKSVVTIKYTLGIIYIPPFSPTPSVNMTICCQTRSRSPRAIHHNCCPCPLLLFLFPLKRKSPFFRSQPCLQSSTFHITTRVPFMPPVGNHSLFLQNKGKEKYRRRLTRLASLRSPYSKSQTNCKKEKGNVKFNRAKLEFLFCQISSSPRPMAKVNSRDPPTREVRPSKHDACFPSVLQQCSWLNRRLASSRRDTQYSPRHQC